MRQQNAVYQCGLERVRQIQTCLNLAAQFESGCRMDPASSGIGCAINRRLTPTELRCLRMYYNDGLQQKQIASMLHRSQSTISRTLCRGEAKMAWALELPQLLQQKRY